MRGRWILILRALRVCVDRHCHCLLRPKPAPRFWGPSRDQFCTSILFIPRHRTPISLSMLLWDERLQISQSNRHLHPFQYDLIGIRTMCFTYGAAVEADEAYCGRRSIRITSASRLIRIIGSLVNYS
jgi:hypothetical protein